MRCSIFSDLPSPPPGQTGWMWTAESSQNPEKTADSYPLPRITVVTPSYNQGQFVEATIRSVLLQDYPNLEYIIIDGGSTDNSVAIIQKYAPWLAFWVSEKDHGQAHAINKGFARATGDIYAYLNSDDYYEPGALNGCARAFREGHQWVVGQVRCWQDGVGYWPFPELPGKSFAKWFLSCPIPQAGCFWSAELHREMGGFREDLNVIIDYEFWLRFRFVKKIEPFVIEQPVAVYRLHSQSKTVNRKLEFTREGDPVREQYKRHLTGLQRVWLWIARRHRQARVRGTKAVSLLKTGDFKAATRLLTAAFVVWPLLVFDFHGFFLALKELSGRNQNVPSIVEVWPEWDE
ncbi:MAG: glycosyltransferase family 2 protein [Desulfobacterales bacterium]